MSGSAAAVVVIPIVGFCALGIMIGLVLLASRRPSGKDHGLRPCWNVPGGSFRGDGRQVTPRRDREPPEAAVYQRSSRDGEKGG